MSAAPRPGGLGPWFCALFFNLNRKSKKQTHLIAHTWPHLAGDLLNKPGGKDAWIMMLKVGPFAQCDAAEAFLALWTGHNKGQQRRLERGIELYARYRHQYAELVLWGQTQMTVPTAPTNGGGGEDTQAAADDDDADADADDPPSAKRLRADPPLADLASVRASFAQGSALTIQGLSAICGGHFGMSAK